MPFVKFSAYWYITQPEWPTTAPVLAWTKPVICSSFREFLVFVKPKCVQSVSIVFWIIKRLLKCSHKQLVHVLFNIPIYSHEFSNAYLCHKNFFSCKKICLNPSDVFQFTLRPATTHIIYVDFPESLLTSK